MRMGVLNGMSGVDPISIFSISLYPFYKLIAAFFFFFFFFCCGLIYSVHYINEVL